ncbi:MAG TPA: cytochrome c-552 precursor, partial [Rhodospirillaceae bacterium]|nr:cytochrome c-552 precursor [Rhodospirillaceae bacterium]
MKSVRFSPSFAGVALAAAALWAAPAGAVDWAGVAGKDVTMFYPGQAPFEWVLTGTEHSGAPVFKDGKNCHECHDLPGKSEAATMGKKIAAGEKLEPTPIAGKAGSITANIKVAKDADKLYVRLEFPDTPVAGAKMDPDNAVKVTMMLDNGKVPEFARMGCWATCHDNLATMPSGGTGDTSKYIKQSRVKMTRQGGADVKPADELEKLRADGVFLEYWQAKLNPGKPAVAVDGFILDKRAANASPAVTAEGKLEGGKWVVVLSRKLAAGAPYKELAAGKPYSLG